MSPPTSDEGRADEPAAASGSGSDKDATEDKTETQNNDDHDDEVDDTQAAASNNNDDEVDTPPQETCKPWEAPPPPEWLEHHRTELWPSYDPSSYSWPDLLADLMRTPVGGGGLGGRVASVVPTFD
jgi:hypothetical protein